MKLSGRTQLALFIVLFAFLLACLTSEVVRYSRNFPSQHPEWVNSKLLLENPSTGAIESMTTRNFFEKNRLNLHAWHGYNEFLLTTPFELGSLDFRAQVAPNSYLTIILNKNAESSSAIRLSRNPQYPSLYTKVAADGRFLKKETISNIDLSDGWHTFNLTTQNDQLFLEIDDRQVAQWVFQSQDARLLGFRSGAHAVSVDNVTATDADGRIIVSESFRNQLHTLLLTGFLLMFIGMLIGAAFWVAQQRQKNQRKTGLGVLTAQIVAIAVISIYFAFDFFYWSGKYPFKTFIPVAYHAEFSLKRANIESYRASLFDSFRYFDRLSLSGYAVSPEILGVMEFLHVDKRPPYQHKNVLVKRSGWLDEPYREMTPAEAAVQLTKPLRPDASYRVMFIGGSQTWGEGASRRADQLAFQCHDLLAEKTGDAIDLTTINCAIRGGESAELFTRYKDQLIRLQPDLVVANMSNNDSYHPPEKFRANLTNLAALNRSQGIETIFVLEPNSPETNEERRAALKQFHQIMREVASKYDIPCLDLPAYLSGSDVDGSGFLWWDYVHLTSYGQTLAGEFIAQAIVDKIQLRDK